MDRVHRSWSAFGTWRTLGWSEASGNSCRTSQPRPSAPCFAARIPGSRWRCPAGARRNGSAPFRTCPTAFPPATLPATCFPGWIRGSSRSVSLIRPGRWRPSCPARWRPSPAGRCAVPMAGLRWSSRSTWSASGPLLSLPKGNMLTLGQVRTEEKSNEITAIPGLLEMLELGWRGSVPPGAIVLLSSDSVTRIEKRPCHPSHRSRPPHCRQRWLYQHPFSPPRLPTFPAPLTEQAMNPHGTLGTAQFLTAQQGYLHHCFPNIQTQKEL